MEIGVKVIAENIQTQIARHANSCFFTMVAVDGDHKPNRIPTLQPQTEDEKRRWENAIIRRQLREEFEERRNSIRNS